MEKSRLNRWPVFLGLGALLFILLSAVWANHEQLTVQAEVRHTLITEKTIQSIWADALEMESSERGYLLTKQPQMRRRFEAAGKRATAASATLVNLSRSSAQRQRAMRLNRLIADHLSTDKTALDPQYVESSLQISEALARDTVALSEVRDLVDAMALEERSVLEQHEAGVRDAFTVSMSLMGALAATIAYLTFFVLRGLSRQVAALSASESRLKKSFELLKAESAARDKAEAELRQLQKMESIGQLAGGIAHDFNNMLAVIMSALQMAKRRLASDPDRSENYMDQAIVGAKRAAQLTSKILAFSRRHPLHPRYLNLRHALAGITEMLHRMLGETYNIRTNLSQDLWPVFLDSDQLENAILNLAINSRDAMPEGGAITIDAHNVSVDATGACPDIPEGQPGIPRGQYVLISVTDTGGGIPEAILHKVVEPFFTTKEVGKGTGLGLSQVHGFVSQSHGHFRISSRPGQGTQVQMYFEAQAMDALAEPQADSHGQARDAAAYNETILVVEDDAAVRQASIDFLHELGYQALSAENGEAALSIFAAHPEVDLVFTDVVMPGLNGAEVAAKLRKKRPDLKVLFTSGYADTGVMRDGVLDEGVMFLEKPFTLEQLDSKIRQALHAP